MSFCGFDHVCRPQAAPILGAVLVLSGALATLGAQAQAPDRLLRCDNNHYTHQSELGRDSRAVNCKPVEGGNVTVVQGPRPAAGAASAPLRVAAARPSAPAAGAPAGNRVDSAEQRARDSDARAILEAELRKAESRRAELTKEFNNGEPEKRGDESRNYQKYLDRVAEMKSAIARTDSDITGIQREINRLAPAAPR
jgi:hypothetical protein